MIYTSSIGVGASEENIRLLLIEDKISEDEEGLLIVKHISNKQILMNKSTAKSLYNYLEKYLKK